MDIGELFSICRELAERPPSVEATRRMHQLLVLSCGTQQGIAFGNLFAQIEWLCKEHHLSVSDTIAIQTARRHSNSNEPPTADDWLYDLRAVARFISALSSQPVPSDLLRLLPPTDRQPAVVRSGQHFVCIRCIADHWNDTTLWADSDIGPLAVDYSGHDDLRKILRRGMQLNLIDGTIAPDADGTNRVECKLIIVEPDFLVDVSSLAVCFTPYGHHPLLYTLNRLKPRPNSQAVLLGNFAGEALDALIHNPQATTDAVLQRTWRQQPLRFAACDDFDEQKFRREAAIQMQNIRETVAQLRPTHGDEASNDEKPFLLEPSFVCERLGLQGRVDLMRADMSLLVEQKSGKNMKIEHHSHDPHGLQLESHYVQLLLYYGILRYNFQKSDRQIDTRLLYSHYPPDEGLLVVNYYRTLLREALRLRNQIVATELFIAREGFGRIIPLLTPDTIYKDPARDGFFHHFILPELTALGILLAALTPLERAYYTTMMTFVYREQAAQKLGSAGAQLHHSGGCASDLWQMPLQEKIATGNIYLQLTITAREKSDDEGGYDLITLTMPAEEADDSGLSESAWGVSNFRQGDMVCLYSYDGKPDVRRSILYKGTLQHIGSRSLTVFLNDGQQNPDVFIVGNSATWAIEHVHSDTGTNSQIRALHQFIGCNPRRRQLLLGQRTPEADTTIRLSRSYNEAYDDIILRQRQARDYFLLQGPPGTGKTSMALRFMVVEELAANRSACVLLTAYTNRAVDEICAMLTDAGLDFLRISHSQAPTNNAPIIVGTTSMLQAHPYIVELNHFSLCIVDEASQILEPAIIGLLSSDHIDRFVLVGDHKQLPAVVQQDASLTRVADPLLTAIGLTDCRQSLFERLLRWEQQQGRTPFTGVLHRQGRMHPQVAFFSSQHFYAAEQIEAVPLPHQQEDALPYLLPARDKLDALLKSHRVVFIPVVPEPLPVNDQYNTAEARVVADLIERIIRFYADRFDPEKSLGVIVPYRSQIAAIRRALSHLTPSLLPLTSSLTIDTVERYQGSQRDVIIFSATVSRRYQLDFLAQNTFVETDREDPSVGQPIDRKLNVALTRARHQTILVGNPDVLNHNPLYSQLIRQYPSNKILA